jgi:hypothetical protein
MGLLILVVMVMLFGHVSHSWILCGCDVSIRDSLLSVSDCFNRLRGLCDGNSLRWQLEGSNQPDEPWPQRETWHFQNNSLLDGSCVDHPLAGSQVVMVWDRKHLSVTLSEGVVNGTLVVHNATASSTPTSSGLMYLQDVLFPRSPHMYSVRALDAARRVIQFYTFAPLRHGYPSCVLTFSQTAKPLETNTVHLIAVVIGSVLAGVGAASAVTCILVARRRQRGAAYIRVN